MEVLPLRQQQLPLLIGAGGWSEALTVALISWRCLQVSLSCVYIVSYSLELMMDDGRVDCILYSVGSVVVSLSSGGSRELGVDKC